MSRVWGDEKELPKERRSGERGVLEPRRRELRRRKGAATSSTGSVSKMSAWNLTLDLH